MHALGKSMQQREQAFKPSSVRDVPPSIMLISPILCQTHQVKSSVSILVACLQVGPCLQQNLPVQRSVPIDVY